MRHDLTKEVSTKMLYGHHNKPANQGGTDYEAAFNIIHKPRPKEDSNLSLKYLFTPSKREAGIILTSKECKLKYRHVKKLGERVET